MTYDFEDNPALDYDEDLAQPCPTCGAHRSVRYARARKAGNPRRRIEVCRFCDLGEPRPPRPSMASPSNPYDGIGFALLIGGAIVLGAYGAAGMVGVGVVLVLIALWLAAGRG